MIYKPYSSGILNISGSDWDAMTEKDKIQYIPGWDYLAPEEKEKWDMYFEYNRPMDTKIYNSNGKINDEHSEQILFGNYDLGQTELWNREWDYKRVFFEELISPLSDYTFEVIGGGFGSKLWPDGMGTKGGTLESWEKIVITHVPSGSKHTIWEDDSNGTQLAGGNNNHRKITTTYDKDLQQNVISYSGAKNTEKL